MTDIKLNGRNKKSANKEILIKSKNWVIAQKQFVLLKPWNKVNVYDSEIAVFSPSISFRSYWLQNIHKYISKSFLLFVWTQKQNNSWKRSSFIQRYEFAFRIISEYPLKKSVKIEIKVGNSRVLFCEFFLQKNIFYVQK
jgi:hypothetical protein